MKQVYPVLFFLLFLIATGRAGAQSPLAIQTGQSPAAGTDSSPVPHPTGTVQTLAPPSLQTTVAPANSTPNGVVYTCDPSISTSICQILNGTIAGLYSSAFSNANASIYITFGNTGLGQSVTSIYSTNYSSFRPALIASATSSNDTTAINSSVPSANPFGSDSVSMTNANARALGFSPTFGLQSDGATACNLGASGCYDGVITISSNAYGSGQLYFRSGPPITGSQYDFFIVVEHETDEVLGTASCAIGCSRAFEPTDLFRYHSNGTRSFGAGGNSDSCSSASSNNACFSIDGIHMLQQYNNIDNGQDAGDWLTDCNSPLVQDAVACPGVAFVDISSTREIELLDVVGFTLVGSAATPGATTSPASSITGTTATLGGSVNPHGADTHVWFNYSTNSSMAGSISTAQQDIGAGSSSVAVSTSLSGLAAGTTYYFQVWASNSAGTNSGVILSFTTTSSSPPTVNTNSASSVSASAATLNGTVNPNGLDTHVWFSYSTNSSMIGATPTAQQDIGAGTTPVSVSAVVSGLAAGTTYYFQVLASNSSGTSSGAVLSFTTTAAAQPPTVTTGSVSSVTTSSATLNGTANPNGTDTHVWFTYGTNSSMTGSISTAQQDIGSGTGGSAFGAGIGGLAANTTYYYQAWGSSSAGSSHGAVGSFTTLSLPLPDLVITSLTAPTTGNPGGTINVSMTVANQGTAAAGAFNVEFYFSSTSSISTSSVDSGYGCSFSSLGAVAATSCNLAVVIPAGLSPGTWYFGANADPANQVMESNKSNNTRLADTGPIVLSLPAFTLSGNINLSGIGLGGVTVTLSGSASGSTTTNGAGNYSFGAIISGSNVTVTPVLFGYSFTPPNQTFVLSGNQTANFTAVSVGSATISGQVTVGGVAFSGVSINVNGSQTTSTTTNSAGVYSISLASSGTYTLTAALAGYSFSSAVTVSNLNGNQTANFTGVAVAGLEFYAVTPCRVADTRVGGGFSGAFGPPSLAAGGTRTFPIPSGSCGIPANAAAYSMNLTTVTKGYLGYLSIWPAGQSIPNVSTLNSYSATPTAVSNAAIVPAGASGAVNVYATDSTDLIIDIDGYFAPPVAGGLQFFPVTPCRLVDTRVASFQSGFGPPTMVPGQITTYPIPSNAACAIPSAAAAYSLNVTAIPKSTLGILSIWPAGKPLPNVSTLNVYAPGTVVANAAIVPAGTSGGINTYVTDTTDLVIDINGYFALPAANGLKLYPVTPCRVADTRAGAGFSGPFGAPAMTAGSQRSFPVPQSACGIPSGAGAYSFNFTAVPQAPQLGIFTTWPTGQAQPNVSTMNSYNGSVVANAAIVPAGANGAISISVTDTTDVLFDINGYFAQ